MLIITNTDEVYEGTPTTIVNAMRQGGRLEYPDSKAHYMAEVQARMALWDGSTIDTSTPAAFLASLAEANMLEVLLPDAET